MKPSRSVVSCAFVASFIATEAAQAQTATFRWIGESPASWVRANGISANGAIVVGYGRPPDFVDYPYSAFIWTPARGFRWIDQSQLENTRWPNVQRCSADGSTLVGEINGPGSKWEAFRWTEQGGFKLYGDLPGGMFSSVARAVSDDGGVVALSATNEVDQMAAYGTSAGAIVPITEPGGALVQGAAVCVSRDGLVLAGGRYTGPGHESLEAFVWTQASGLRMLGDFPGGAVWSLAWWISPEGSTILGNSENADGVRPFKWTEATGMVQLAHLPTVGLSTYLLAASADGSTAVGYSGVKNTGTGAAVIWTEAGGTRLLTEVLAQHGVLVTNAVLYLATGISDDGRTIVGQGRRGNRDMSWIVQLPGESCASPTVVDVSVPIQTWVGGRFELAVGITGSPPFSYQWLRNEAPIPGATGDRYSVGWPLAAHTGSYTCTVSNACGTATAGPIEVAVCLADIDSNGFVNGNDFDAFVDAFEFGGLVDVDVNDDDHINGDDFDLFVASFEAGC